MSNGKASEPKAPSSSSGALTTVNPQILSAVSSTNKSVLGASKETGAGVAYQKVSQAAAFAVQDATDYMRNVMTVALTAQGIALKLMIEKKDPSYAPVLAAAQEAVTMANTAFGAIGATAGTVVSSFPTGA
ncbi:MAG TPA: hypothetical protein VN980_05865 [Alphaproteobacteria bacterium]|nr:hypothetical protein [Alphaproteobacteria bacterium]